MLYMAHDTFLCNQMFPFANVIAFALENDQTVIYPSFSKHADKFLYFERNELCQFPADAKASRYWKILASNRTLERLLLRANHAVHLFPYVLMTPDQSYDFEAASNREMNQKMISANFAPLNGLYLLSHNNFIRAKETIKHVFSPTIDVARKVDDCIGRARQGAEILIGAHMRFGDYLTFKKDMAYSIDEYYEVMLKFKRLFHNRKVTFLLCSDQPQDPRNFPEVCAETAPGSAVEDLYCLSKCDLIIGPPSTFSQWASFYGDVPIFTINYKNEIIYGLKTTEPNIKELYIHRSGFGRHSTRRLASLKSTLTS